MRMDREQDALDSAYANANPEHPPPMMMISLVVLLICNSEKKLGYETVYGLVVVNRTLDWMLR